MTYATLMVNMRPGHRNAALLQVAAGLAERFQAEIIGIAACQPLLSVYGDGFVAGAVIDQDQGVIEKELRDAEAEFHAALDGRVEAIEWRSAVTYGSMCEYLSCHARSADIVLTGVSPGVLRGVDTGDLIMAAGRPVLTVPDSAEPLKLEHVLVAWKDTREARRTIFSALPLLKLAGHVLVVEVAAEDDMSASRLRVDDVVHWLTRHGVAAKSLVCASNGDDPERLGDIAREHGMDLIVAGAYGHSRLREWVLGGVTRHLLAGGGRCSLVSH